MVKIIERSKKYFHYFYASKEFLILKTIHTHAHKTNSDGLLVL